MKRAREWVLCCYSRARVARDTYAYIARIVRNYFLSLHDRRRISIRKRTHKKNIRLVCPVLAESETYNETGRYATDRDNKKKKITKKYQNNKKKPASLAIIARDPPNPHDFQPWATVDGYTKRFRLRIDLPYSWLVFVKKQKNIYVYCAGTPSSWVSHPNTYSCWKSRVITGGGGAEIPPGPAFSRGLGNSGILPGARISYPTELFYTYRRVTRQS